MTHLCYSLEETAERLSLSETVLVRLSQFFKVPKAAYEAVGYLSFKGDLLFSDQDIAFFRQVKERLLAGEALDEIKSRMREEVPVGTGTPPVADTPIPQTIGLEPSIQPAPQTTQPLQEIHNRQAYEKAAEESFERYKSLNRPGLTKVFQSMIKEVGKTETPRTEHTPSFRPLRHDPSGNTLIPFRKPLGKRALPYEEVSDTTLPSQPLPEAASEFSDNAPHKPELSFWPRTKTKTPEAVWEPMIQDALSRPRTMNSHLKNAALLLKERALHLSEPSDTHGQSHQ